MTEHDFDYSHAYRIEAKVETHVCQTDFGNAHFRWIEYYDVYQWPDPWGLLQTHSEWEQFTYRIYDRVGHYEYKAKKT